MAFLDKRDRNLEKVEWSGEGLLKDSFRNFLKEIRSLIWVSSSGSDFIPTQLNAKPIQPWVKPFLDEHAFEQH